MSKIHKEVLQLNIKKKKKGKQFKNEERISIDISPAKISKQPLGTWMGRC